MILGLLSRNVKEERRFLKIMVDIVSIVCQVTGFFVWPWVEKDRNQNVWMIPLAITLTSCGWWENYVDRHSPIRKFPHYAPQNSFCHKCFIAYCLNREKLFLRETKNRNVKPSCIVPRLFLSF